MCGQTSVSCSQPTFPADCELLAHGLQERAGYARLVRPLFHTGCYCFQYKLKAIMPCAKSGLAMLGYSSSWFPPFTIVISPLAATMADDDNDKDTHPVGRRSLYFTAKYLYNIPSYHTCETASLIV